VVSAGTPAKSCTALTMQFRAALAGLALLLTALPALAQTGKIAGRVRDTAGETLPGVNVVVVGTTLGAATDADGYYTILGVRPGTVTVRASALGYATRTVAGVRVQIDQTTELDFRLPEEGVEGEELVVTAERPLVQRDLTSSSTSVSSEELRALPVQSFQDVVNLQAGVVEGHFRGGRVGEVAYLVDGVPVNDVFDQSYAFQVENNAIQEVQIISGTFNAEYGQAQSGVVNIVTKDGGERYEGAFQAYGGGYVTGATRLFPQATRLPGAYEAQGALSGPVPGLGRRLTFFSSGRFVRNDGFLYGRRIVRPVYAATNERVPVELEGRTVYVPALGDSSYQSLNWSQQATAQGKLTARLWGSDRFTVSGLVQRDRGQNFHPLFRYNPEGVPTVYGASASVISTFTHVFGGGKTFVDARGAYFANGVDEYVYEDPLDPRYPNDAALRELAPSFSFYLGGVSMRHFARRTRTATGRLDLTSQVSRAHLVKAGAEVKRHTLTLDDFEVKNNAATGFTPAIPRAGTPDHVLYRQTPVEASAYAQDKIELGYLVLNAGVRLDYFDARSDIPADFAYPDSGRTATRAKWQLSPRVGLAYPLSAQGVVHVAYGHFFQMPPFDFLYTNPDYIYNPEVGIGRAFGYADLKPQQTVAYEIGLQQALNDVIGVDLTFYYKDIRNLLGTRIETRGPNQDNPLVRYGRFVNRDYGQVKGLIFALERRYAQGFALRVDYTFQVARGNTSDPRDALIAEQAGNEPEKQLVPLDWDRRHQLNAQLTLGDAARGFGLVSLIGRLGSGLPYTPSQADERTGLENSARRPGEATADLFATRRINVGGLQPGLFLRIYNLFDARTVRNVYTDTGQPTPNLRYYSGEPLGLNTKDEYLLRPDFYGAPRMIQVGVSVDF
jgi:outer membrane receptor protein involved in Fe transport